MSSMLITATISLKCFEFGHVCLFQNAGNMPITLLDKQPSNNIFYFTWNKTGIALAKSKEWHQQTLARNLVSEISGEPCPVPCSKQLHQLYARQGRECRSIWCCHQSFLASLLSTNSPHQQLNYKTPSPHAFSFPGTDEVSVLPKCGSVVRTSLMSMLMCNQME